MEFEATLRDGTPVLFRPIRPDDRQLLRDGFEKLSPESRYRRFFRHIDHLSEADLDHLTNIDYVDHFAWVAVLHEAPGEPGVGVGRWVRISQEPQVAEGAVTVIDEYQNKGIGRTLLLLLARTAIERGIETFRAWVQADNTPIIELLRSLGARPGKIESAVMELNMPLPKDVAALDLSPSPLILKASASGELHGEADVQPPLSRTIFTRPDSANRASPSRCDPAEK